VNTNLAADVLPDKYQSRISMSNEAGCWEWTGTLHYKGYGALRSRAPIEGVVIRLSSFAHRAVYQLLVGEVPSDLQLDHLCRNRRCVNPAHLEPVTAKENARRGIAGLVNGARHAARTHCCHGHELSGANVYRRPNGHRRCRACHRMHGAGESAKCLVCGVEFITKWRATNRLCGDPACRSEFGRRMGVKSGVVRRAARQFKVVK
jgi:hypothetical protein